MLIKNISLFFVLLVFSSCKENTQQKHIGNTKVDKVVLNWKV